MKNLHTDKIGTTRRKLLKSGAAAAALSGLPLRAFAQQGDVVLGASVPLTGPFAFAGAGINDGIADYVDIINQDGGIAGRAVRYEREDTGYKVDASVAAFSRITDQYDVNVYYGDSTGFSKTIASELERRGSMILGGSSFASELNDPAAFPYHFIAGPDYSEQVNILLSYIAETSPGASIAFVNSDTEFGRDPIDRSLQRAEELGLEVVAEVLTPPTSVDVSTEVLRLRRADPEFTIFHGYVLAPIPEFVQQMRQLGLRSRFMGTFYSMDQEMVKRMGEAADGFMGVMPYRYSDDNNGDAPMMDRIRAMREDYQTIFYTQGFLSAMLMLEAVRRAIESGQDLNGRTVKAALNTLENFDTGGLIGTPITITGNSVPVGRIYQFDGGQGRMLPVSDWIDLDA